MGRQGINEYILDTPIAELPEDSLIEFSDFNYLTFKEDSDIVRIFPGEVFYIANNNMFLGRECLETVVASLNGKIYKVFFRFTSPSHEEDTTFREDLYDYLVDKHGNPTEVRKIDEWRKVHVWDGDFGNVVMDADMVGTAVIYTSSILRPKKNSFFGRIFGA